MSRKKLSSLIGVVLVIVLIIFLVVRNGDQEVIDDQEKVYSVETLVVGMTDQDTYLEYSALIKNKDLEEVTFPTVATIKEVHVKEGDFVNKGDLLVVLESTNASAQKDNAYNLMISAENVMKTSESNLELASKQYDKVVSDQNNDSEFKTLKANYDKTAKNLEQAQAEVDTIDSKLANLNKELEELESIATTQKVIVEDKKKILDDLTASGEDTTTAQKEYDDANGVYLKTLDDINDKETEINTLNNSSDTALKRANLETAKTQHQVNKIPYDAMVAEREIELAAAENAKNTAKYTYDSSKTSYENAKTNYNNASNSLDDLKYRAKGSGVVLAVVSNVGEVATPLAPVLVLGSDALVAEFGISAADVESVKINNRAIVTRKDVDFFGEVINVSVVPDEVSRTYLTEVLIDENDSDFLIGELVSVKVFIGESSGIYLPINAILNDGEDYVFVLESKRAVRKNIKIVAVNDNQVMIDGLNIGDEVITMGNKSLKSGYLVSVVK